MAQFPGFAAPDVGMVDADDDDPSTSRNDSLNSAVSRTADQFGTALRISPPKLSIPNPLRNYFAVSAVVEPNFVPPPFPPDDEMVTTATTVPAGPPQALPMTPVYFPPKEAAAPPPPPVNNYQAEKRSSSLFSAPPAAVQNVDTPRPKAPAKAPARNKVPLEKGYSQMVWLRLMQSEPDLAGLKGESPRRLLSMEEVIEHQSQGEAWTVLRGRVYNVTPYLKFHPGGPEMLMKAAGKDCTALFNKYHAWVNAEFLLEKCMVGLLDQGQGEN